MNSKFIIIFFPYLLLFTLIVSGQNILSSVDKQQIISILDNLVQNINSGNYQKISLLISPNNNVLQLDIQDKIKNVTEYQLEYLPFDQNIKIIDQNKIKVKARFSASGFGWKISGLPIYFNF